MSLSTLHYLSESGVREVVTSEYTHALVPVALDLSRSRPVFVCSVDDEGRLSVMCYLRGVFTGTALISADNLPARQMDEDDGDLMGANC